MKKLKNIIFGILLIAIGLILGLNALEITNINIFFDGWWTLIIIIPCFIDLLDGKDKTGNIIQYSTSTNLGNMPYWYVAKVDGTPLNNGTYGNFPFPNELNKPAYNNILQ